MINLLPPDLKEEYRYARFNHKLATWLGAFVAAIAGVALIAFIGVLMMNSSINTYKTRVSNAQHELSADNATAVDKQVGDISNNLKLMVTVLSKEILFSKLLSQLGSLTPSDVILTNLSISQTETAIDITAQTGSYNAASQFQVNLQDPRNQIFSKADIVSISCATGQAVTDPKHPCTVNIRAQFTQNNPFLFINASKQGAAH